MSDVKVYVVEMTEYERGWGNRPDGYLAFATEEDADAYLKAEYQIRWGRSVPEYTEYTDYEARLPRNTSIALTS